ncbi:Hypothetical protein CINCED_3A001664 [Cinara cedri]|uniref:Uncharacterized protein n=1 Tax=Cinara cedri TaxID=506608 RepID=A0A5E4NLL8_9HEMI|nr:Hypothetical protein CINCED_3A001664 [Cinara cedri]
MATGMFGKCVVKLLVVISVTIGLHFLIVSMLGFGRFLAGFSSPLSVCLPSDIHNIYFRIIVDWTLASCYLYSPRIVGCAVQQIVNLSGLPSCYFKFTKIVLLVSILNGKITLWQAIPEICLWHLNYAEHTHLYLHCSMWIIWLMIVFAIDIMEITGVKTVM